MFNPQPSKEVQSKLDLFYRYHDNSVIKNKYMSFHHDEREDLWRLIWDIRGNPVKSPQERQKRDTYINVLMQEIKDKR